ncbi:MAG: hypothetical protein IJZ68_04570 [Bacteroidaceae bacterium]|nr:hypothetical protein [Bacteroidaceae bacterium]
MKEIRVSFSVFVNDDEERNPNNRLTKEFVEKRIEELGNTILDAFDETIHDVEIK